MLCISNKLEEKSVQSWIANYVYICYNIRHFYYIASVSIKLSLSITVNIIRSTA